MVKSKLRYGLISLEQTPLTLKYLEEQKSRVEKPQNKVLPPPLASSGACTSTLKDSEPQFPHLQRENNGS